ncbi:hypothetical protein SAMN04488004_12729 [Loktanella salsilacus]|jgi:hypothetical protein|uniref:Uncharacterized protein n=1 Tax=Loktanella salsilacus TaxID=195913 RepID=A0A1I4IMK3_9RHOB|nr:hypothetical protein [Loktanella salsilacus]SFL55223.1 hypothetical protein SAMN04488004_12729 [Loktanella salsilacus]
MPFPTIPGERLTAFRDRTLLAYSFASGGRGRNDIANLTFEMIEDMPAVMPGTQGVDQMLAAANIPLMRISLWRSKTIDDEADIYVYRTGEVDLQLNKLTMPSEISSRPIFPSAHRWGNIAAQAWIMVASI